MNIAKPFLKWAGGKGAIVEQLASFLPDDFTQQKDITYIEPFVGGGAMLFYMLTHYPNISRAIINDVNEDLICCYQLIKNNPYSLIGLLKKISEEFFYISDIEDRAKFYYMMRDRYNNDELTIEERSACFIFLNKTCFNGLYRVNTSGKFNVPFGKYKKPLICDEKLLLIAHELLQKVEIHAGNYDNITNHLSGKSYKFVYIDPPYRPLSGSSCFIEYTRKTFDDSEQEKLKKYCDFLSKKKCKVMQSNSNSLGEDGEPYFNSLYEKYRIIQIKAHRFINAYAGKREKETELLILNY